MEKNLRQIKTPMLYKEYLRTGIGNNHIFGVLLRMKLTKKGSLQRRIDEKSEQIDILKAGLSGIVKRYGYHNVKEFYGEYHTAQRSYWDYQDKIKEWEDTYGVSAKPKQKSIHERIQEYQKKADEQNRGRQIYSKDRGAR